MTDIEKEEIIESEEETAEVEGEETVEATESPENSELEKLSAELEEAQNSKLRLQADFDNYRKRVEREKQSLINYAVEGMVSELLPVIDNFERALEVKEADFEGFYQGVEMIKNQFIEALKSQGLEEIEALDQPFDPNYHNAVSQMESEDHDSDIVVQVFQKGYKIKDKVVRPSMVVVSK
ncbi:protein GrpE [Andreesenia angusta]|uniref:Protein GrpE n=1 Tax=Andreesenia angusta TaxID=39480 RepID=A0A1S1V7H7_9FIRM|nr:nucleotide exchange factor GrpE [Andreesenia angusta]OHW62551.1 protein GrpE [Andreesenia angusta]